MSRSRWYWRAVGFGLVAVAFFSLAIGISGLELSSGKPLGLKLSPWLSGLSPFPKIQGSLLDILFNVIMFFYWPFLIFAAVYLVISPRTRRRVLRNTAYLTLLYVVVFLFSRLRQRSILSAAGPSQSSDSSQSLDAAGVIPVETNPPEWTVFLISLVLILILIALVWYVFRQWGQPDRAMDDLVEEARAALSELSRGADLRDTIIRCYHEMCQVLRFQKGIHRDQAMTPREFEASLAVAGFRTEHILRLTQLFEKVRYGRWAPDKMAEREAMDCLAAIVQTYGDGT